MKKKNSNLTVAVIGSGPAGLMAADVISSQGIQVTIFDVNKAPAKKLLIAGSSGLNITNAETLSQFHTHYPGTEDFFKKIFKEFSRDDWISFLNQMKIETFIGTSRRYFTKAMKASKLVRAWLQKLSSQNVEFKKQHRLIDFEIKNKKVVCTFEKENSQTVQYEFDRICICTGGASYISETVVSDLVTLLKKKKIQTSPFTPANVGFSVDWPKQIKEKIKFKPLKNIEFRSPSGVLKGDLMISDYGLEGTPIYTLGSEGKCSIDLKPDLTGDEILKKCRSVKENLSPFRRLQKKSILTEPALTMVYHMTPKEVLNDLEKLIEYIKNFPIELESPQPIQNAISSNGGVLLSELFDQLNFRKYPQIYAAGELLNWTTTTGGYLIQACVSTGYYAGFNLVQSFNT